MVIFHDKLTEYGGSEVVLKTLVTKLKPTVIYTACINHNIDWYSIYKTKIIAPKSLLWVNSQKKYRLFYPLICLFVYVFRIKCTKIDRAIIYSSTAAKYFSIKNIDQVVFYSNFPAKPLVRYDDYIHKVGLSSDIRLFLFNVLKYFWIKIELSQLKKFSQINVISEQTASEYKTLYGDELPSLNVIHCPADHVSYNLAINRNKNSLYREKPPIEACIISRLYPEKTLEPLLEYLQSLNELSVNVIGDGPLLSYFVSKYQSIKFHGFISTIQKNKMVKSSDVVFVPTSQEWSLVTVESNLVGVPVIAKYSKSIEEINQLISNTNDRPNLMYNNVDEIAKLLLDLSDSNCILSENYKSINSYFSDERFISALCNKFEDL
jgi:hypothetical protein